MTFAAVGSLFQARIGGVTFTGPAATTIGNLFVLQLINETDSVTEVSALSSSSAIWTQVGTHFNGTTNTGTVTTFIGKVTSTSAATVTITFAGLTPGTTQIIGHEFSSTVGSWAFDAQGHIDSAGTNTWATLTPSGTGELYFGYAENSGVASAGSTSGFTYALDSNSNGVAWNTNVSSATAPVWGDSGHTFGGMILIKEVSGGIQLDTAGLTEVTTAGTSATIDITNAANNSWVYLWCAISTGSTTQTGVPSNASWTTLQSTQTTAGTSGATYALYRRQKQSGDTTFSFTWPTNSGKGAFAWVSYTGLNNSTPDEQSAITQNDVTSRAAIPTPSATPSASGRWAVGFFGQRSTTTGNRPSSWTQDAALLEREEADNRAAVTSPWLGIDIEDSASAVTVASHSYTATSNQTESHDGSAIIFLIPAVTAAVPAPTLPNAFPPHQPYPLSVLGQASTLLPQNPASIPGVFVQGITANVNVAANFGKVTFNFISQQQFPFPPHQPYPLSVIGGASTLVPQRPANIPAVYVQGLTAKVSVAANFGLNFISTNFAQQFPFSAHQPFPLSIIGSASTLVPQKPASIPGVFVYGITATDTVTANFGSISTSLAGNVSTVNIASNFGGEFIFSPKVIPAPFPLSSPWPLTLYGGSFAYLQPQHVTAKPNNVFIQGITAVVNISSAFGTPNIITPEFPTLPTPTPLNAPWPLNVTTKLKPQHPTAIPQVIVSGNTASVIVVSNTPKQIYITTNFQQSFGFNNSVPYPLNIVSTLRPQKPANIPSVFVQGITATVNISAGFGAIKTSLPGTTSNVNISAFFGNIIGPFRPVQPQFPFRNYPYPLNIISNLRPQNNAIFTPTGHGSAPAASVIASANFGAVTIGISADIGKVTVQANVGIVTETDNEMVARVNAVANFGSISTHLTISPAAVSVAANQTNHFISIPGKVSNVNANPEFGRITISANVHGNVSIVNESANFGTVLVKVSNHVNVAIASSVHIKESITGIVSRVNAAASPPAITISKTLVSTSNVQAVNGHATVSEPGKTARVSVASRVSISVSVSESASNVNAISIQSKQVSVSGLVSSDNSTAPTGTVRVSVSRNPSNVNAVAQKQGTAVHGITATVSSSAIFGSIASSVNLIANASVQTYLGLAGQIELTGKLITIKHHPKLIRPVVYGNH